MKPISPCPLKLLKKKFNDFRSTSRSQARIPDHLRKEVLEAAAAGVTPTQINAVVGVTRTQLSRWQRVALPAKQSPRVLRVVKEPSPEALEKALLSGLRISFEAGRLLLEWSF